MSVLLREELQATLGGTHVIERELTGGGMACVFLARDIALERHVVVKVLPEAASDIDTERFRREVALAAKLQHPNIVGVLSAGEGNGLLYYIMPHVEGESLRERLAAVGRMPISEAVRILTDVGRALVFAHEHQVVHRDIKPDNVLLSARAAAVTDFGIAKALFRSRRVSSSRATPLPADPLTCTGASMAVGTLAYMAPEQAAAEDVDGRTDIYAFGVMAYELLCGMTPFRATSPHALLAAHLRDKPTPITRYRRDVPPPLAELVMRCLEKEPALRPQTATELVDALEAIGPSGQTATYARHRQRISGRLRTFAGVLTVIAALVIAAVTLRSGTAERTKSLAVLPFANVSGDPANDFLGDGMSEELIAALGKIAGLRVAARTSSFAFRGRNTDAREIGRALSVGTVLSGSVHRSGSHLRVLTQLVRADNGFTLWSETYDRTIDDVLAVEDEIARAIVDALQVQLLRRERTTLARRPTSDVTAYELYLRGRYEWSRRKLASLQRALVYYDSAVAKDTSFALAYAGIADVYVVLANWGYLGTREAGERSLAAARRAVALDSTLAEGHASLASVLCTYLWDWPASESEFRKAITLNPGLATTRYFYSRCLSGHGRFAEARTQGRVAITLDPLNPQIATALAAAFLAAGENDSAIIVSRRALRSDPANVAALYWLAAAYGAKRDIPAARATVASLGTPERASPIMLSLSGALAALSRDTVAALAAIRALPAGERGNAFNIAQIYAALGERDRALAWLERAYEERSDGLVVSARVLPWLAGLRSDARFVSLLRRCGVAG